MPNTQYAIRLEHITKTFGEVTANHDVTLEKHLKPKRYES